MRRTARPDLDPIYTQPAHVRQAAAVAVCSRAKNLPDALLLLAMLGLDTRTWTPRKSLR